MERAGDTFNGGFLTGLVEQGMRVRILTNSLASNDVGIVHSGYSKYRKALLRGGVELYELNKKLSRQQRKEKKGVGGSSKASLHAKSFVFDRKQVFIGSLNLDPRSFYENSEIGVVISSAETAEVMAKEFEEVIESGVFRLELVTDDEDRDSFQIPEFATRMLEKNLLGKRQAIWGRILAMKLLGVPYPELNGFHLFENWLDLPLKEKVKSVLGTARRIVQRNYFKPLNYSKYQKLVKVD